MQKNLRTKTIVIILTVLVSVYGIIGLPRSVSELKDNLKKNIKLGFEMATTTGTFFPSRTMSISAGVASAS